MTGDAGAATAPRAPWTPGCPWSWPRARPSAGRSSSAWGSPSACRPSDVAELEQGRSARGGRRERRCARRAQCARGGVREAVLGVDTLVTLDGRIYGKPPDRERAAATLRALSGATHQVIGGLALILPDGEPRTAAAVTSVTFRELDEPLLDLVPGRGEWQGRAGGYAIQGAGAALVRADPGRLRERRRAAAGRCCSTCTRHCSSRAPAGFVDSGVFAGDLIEFTGPRAAGRSLSVRYTQAAARARPRVCGQSGGAIGRGVPPLSLSQWVSSAI